MASVRGREAAKMTDSFVIGQRKREGGGGYSKSGGKQEYGKISRIRNGDLAVKTPITRSIYRTNILYMFQSCWALSREKAGKGGRGGDQL